MSQLRSSLLKCKVIAGSTVLLLEDRSLRGTYTNNDYSQVLKVWHEGIARIVDPDAAQKSRSYIQDINNKRTGFFDNKIMRTIDGVEVRMTPGIIDARQSAYSAIISFDPHSDDICFKSEWLRYADKFITPNIHATVFSGDHMGVRPQDGVEIMREWLEGRRHRYREITNAHVVGQMCDCRFNEYVIACMHMGVLPVPHRDLSPFTYYPEAMVYGPEGNMYSYLSRFKKESLDGVLEHVFHICSESWDKRVLIMAPFLFDYHPVHQDVSREVIKFIAGLPAEEREKVDLWLCSTGDSMVGHKGNVFFPYSDPRSKYDLWTRTFKTQSRRNPAYPFANLMVDKHYAAMLGLDAQYAEMFVSVEVG